MTYSIVACDLERREWGVGVQSKFLAVGSLVPWVEAEVGAVATQAHANVRYGPDGLAMLRQGFAADEVVAALTDGDTSRDHRQLGVVDSEGGSATYTGTGCLEWAGGVTGPGYAAQGNILVSRETVEGLARAYEETAGRPLAERLLAALAAAQSAGGDRRGQQSAGLLVARHGGGYEGFDVAVDLRTDDHPEPVAEPARPTPSTICTSARRLPTSGSPSAPSSRPSCASDSAGWATQPPTSPVTSRPGRASRTSRCVWMAPTASTPSCSGSCGPAELGLGGGSAKRL